MTDTAKTASGSIAQRRYAGASANYLVRHLMGVALAIRANVGAAVEASGHELTPATAALVVNLPIDGLGMSELAARLRLTLQRTGQLVSALEDFGYVERVTDASDGRAKRVEFTRRGRKLLEHIDATDATVTKEIASILGEKRFTRLCRDLEELDIAINGPDAVLNL